MKYHELTTNSVKKGKRVGRGIAAGRGKTAGRGTKGQRSRTGSSRKPGFEGGQNPLMQRLPKLPGFKAYKVKAETVYTGQLETLTGKTVTAETLAEAGLITNAYVRVKLIVKGDITKKFDVKLPGASATAIAAIQKVGGTFTQVERLARSKAAEK